MLHWMHLNPLLSAIMIIVIGYGMIAMAGIFGFWYAITGLISALFYIRPARRKTDPIVRAAQIVFGVILGWMIVSWAFPSLTHYLTHVH